MKKNHGGESKKNPEKVSYRVIFSYLITGFNGRGVINIGDLILKTREIYNQNAIAFDQQRDKSLFERAWLELFTKELKKEAKILDVGCGSGEPITSYFIERAFDVTGVDFSPNMLAIARARFPQVSWIEADMRNLNINEPYDGLIAWNSLFHLSQGDQIKTLEKFANYLVSGGFFLFTAGDKKGEVMGRINGHDVYHSSLSAIEYEQILRKCQMQVLSFKLNDTDCCQHSVFLAQKN